MTRHGDRPMTGKFVLLTSIVGMLIVLPSEARAQRQSPGASKKAASVNLNTDTAEEIATKLGIRSSLAEAIVKARPLYRNRVDRDAVLNQLYEERRQAKEAYFNELVRRAKTEQGR